MDIHRSRFVPYPCSAVTSVAFSRPNNKGFSSHHLALKLAIGRQNGDIEIWNPLQGKWVQETVFAGEGASIDGLAWTREPDETGLDGRILLGQYRLFSIASSPTVTEWDLESGHPKRKSTGNFSEVWCLAAQPRTHAQTPDNPENAKSQDLVAGCGDGTIVLLTTTDNDLQFKRFLARVPGKKANCVSIAYQDQDRVIAGFMDSTIRIFDTRNGTTVRTMSLGVGIPGAPKDAVVWQVKSLPNGDIVSGDSNGELAFWDGRSYSLTQRIKGHDSECLDVAISADGKTIFSGSMDGRLAVYRYGTSPSSRKVWARSHQRKIHDGTVKSMSAFDSDGLSVVVSGGTDLTPVVTPLRQYGKENTRALPTIPQNVPVASARHARLLASWWDKSISIWRIARKSTLDLSSDPQPPRKLVAKITLSTRDNIRSVSISDDGRLVAASTSSELKVFQLRKRPDVEVLGIRKLEVPSSLSSSGARLLKFSPDGKWMAAVSLDNEVRIVRLSVVESKPKYLQIIDKVSDLERRHRFDLEQQSGFEKYARTINSLAFAWDSSVLVTGDLSGYLDSWVLEGHEDPTAPAVDVAQHDSKKGDSESEDPDTSDDDDEVYIFYGQHWTDNPTSHLLPQLESAPLVLSFRPPAPKAQLNGAAINGNPGVHSTRQNPHAHSHELPHGEHRLWIMTAGHEMYEFDVLAGRLSDWSRANPSSALPEDFTTIKDRVVGAIWDVKPHHARLWLYGKSWIFMINASTDLASKHRQRMLKRRASASVPDDKRQKLNSGAGDAIPLELREGMPVTVKRYNGIAWSDLFLDREHYDDDEDEERNLRLITAMRDPIRDDYDAVPGGGVKATSQPRKWWCTFKYRPILGMVPLEDDEAGSGEDGGGALEVVLVERPLWDVREER